MRKILLDTGALVALLDKRDRNHIPCRVFFHEFRGQLFLTEPVLTESLYLLSFSIKDQRKCVDFILKSGAELVPQSQQSLARCIILMEKYQDVPMDFADATLVVLAEEIESYEVFTLDKKGFSVYRASRQGFKIWPE